jgi:Protein of unknown function (DUF2844)
MPREAACFEAFKGPPLMKFIPRLALALGLTIGAAAPALAALGGDTASVLADRDQIEGSVHITATASYSVHEITTSFGMTVREYLAPDGKVFGLAWRGPSMPDLRQFLGSYYSQYLQAASAPHAGHRHLSVELPALVVHSGGRMRAFAGRAWAPDLIPQNVSADDIK